MLAERPELELRQQRAAPREPLAQHVGLGSPRRVAAREDHQHRQLGQAAADVAGKLEAGDVGEVDVLHQEHERPLGGRPAEHLDDGLEQARPLELRRARPRRRRVRPHRARTAAARPPARAGRGPRARRRRRRAAGASARASSPSSSAQSPNGAAPPRSSAPQPAAAAPSRSARDCSSSASRVFPIPPSPCRITAPPAPPRASAHARAARRARARGRRAAAAPARARPWPRGRSTRLARAQRRRRGSRSARRERPPRPIGSPATGTGRARAASARAAARRPRRRAAVAERVEAADQLAMGRLGERVELGAAAIERDRRREVAALLGSLRGGRQRRHPALAVLVARRVDPFLVDTGEQLAPASAQRILGTPVAHQRSNSSRSTQTSRSGPRGRPGRASPRAGAPRRRRANGAVPRSRCAGWRARWRRARRARAAPRRPSAAASRDAARAMPGRADLRAGGKRDDCAVEVDHEAPEHMDPQHGASLLPRAGRSQAFIAPSSLLTLV